MSEPKSPETDALAGDWSEGLPPPSRALGIPEPRRITLESAPVVAARAVSEPPPVAAVAEEVDAPDAWASEEDPLTSQPPSVIVQMNPDVTPPTPAPAFLPDVTPTSPAPSFQPDITPASPAPSFQPDVTPASPAPSFQPDITPASPAPSFQPDVTPSTPEPAFEAAPPAAPEPLAGTVVEETVVELGEADSAEVQSEIDQQEPIVELNAEDEWPEPAPAPAAAEAQEPEWQDPATIDLQKTHIRAAPQVAQEPPPPADWSAVSNGPDWNAPAAEAPAGEWAAPQAAAWEADTAWSAPVQTESATAVEWSAPPTEDAPAADWSAPAATEEAPATDWSAPALAEDTPAAEWSAPALAEDAPAAEWSAPAEDAPATDWSAQAPADEAPATDWSEAAPTDDAPAAGWSAPAPSAPQTPQWTPSNNTLLQMEGEPEPIAPEPGAAAELFGSVPAGGSLAEESEEELPDAEVAEEEIVDEDPDLPVAIEDPDLPVALEEAEPPPPVGLAVPGEHRVAVHTRAGRTRRGMVRDVDLALPEFALAPQGGGGEETVQHAEVKAIFFMLAPGTSPRPGGYGRVRVTFEDGRSIEGERDGGEGPQGFFLVPTDAARTNTSRIYVAREATAEITDL
jgi:hypothetical protein